MGNFLGKLTNQLNQQFSVGENQQSNLSGVVDGKTVDYGSLGSFSERIDKSAERKYYEEGYLRTDPYGAKSKQFEILMQEPSATLLIKKRMFSAVAENYKTDYMDSDEKLFFKAMKVMFQNKCRQIARLEALSKIQKITESAGSIDDYLMPIIVGLTDNTDLGIGSEVTAGFGNESSNSEVNKFTQTIDKMRRIYYFNKASTTTKWITDDSSLFSTQFGQGTGVLEITNFTNISTSGTLDIGDPGVASFGISDPYNAMVISEYDIERAISDATNMFYSKKLVQFGKEASETLIDDLQVELNAMRNNRNAGNISFHISQDSIVSRRVTAVIDAEGLSIPFDYDAGFGGVNTLLNAGSGSNVNIDPEYLKGGAVAGNNGLSTEAVKVTFDSGHNSSYRTVNRHESEKSVFTRIVAAVYNKIQLDSNSRNDIKGANERTNYARRKLRFSFLGKTIIQPMDSVHVYINSKSRYDNRLMTGINNMFTGVGILQNLNKTTTDLKNSFDMLFNPSGNIDISVEKQVYVGADFPNSLWSMVRKNFVNEKEGAHVFGGVISGASSSFDSSKGSYVVNINAKDNGEYLKMGKVNFKPAVDTFNGSLYDPLTPYKSSFDAVSSNAKAETYELLDENKELLANPDSNVPLVKFKLGPNAGQIATHENVVQEREVNKNTQLTTRTFFAPDGIVYRWKEGIGGQVYSGSSFEKNNINTVGVPTITDNPFAGQDVMNVISLSITGIPYNFQTYWKTVTELDGFNNDSVGNENAAHSYYTSLRQNLVKNNVLWGNFIPFKELSMDEESYKKVLSGFFKSDASNREIETKLRKVSELRRQSYLFGASGPLPDREQADFANAAVKLDTQLDVLNEDIHKLLEESLKQSKALYANDIQNSDTSHDTTSLLDGTSDNPSNISRRSLRRKLNNLTRRMSYNVRANKDKNLFIVDDFYDKDYDLMAFNKALSKGIELYNNDFLSVAEKVTTAAGLLQLEVFCDSQGHIRVRAPQYNKIPSSIFYRMMELKKTKGIQVFPQFLDDLFSDQIGTLSDRLEIIEDEIRLYCSIVGINVDYKREDFINNNSQIQDGGQFKFLSSSKGVISDFNKIATAEVQSQGEKQSLDDFDKQSRTNKAQYSNYQRSSLISKILTGNKLSQEGYDVHKDFTSNFVANSEIDTIINRIKLKSGNTLNINKFDYIDKTDITSGVDVASYDAIDVFKFSKDIFDKMKERQHLVKLLNGAIKSSIEANSLDDTPDKTRNRLLMPGSYSNKEIPKAFEHMIEDETYDDYGLHSGSRYIIKDSQIKTLTITEVAPDYTYLSVRGVLSPYLANNTLPAGLNVFPNAGNGLVTADAVDYDMWRQYGLIKPNVINVPFLNDPVSQCLPYATMLLGRARKNILQGTLMITGNEYMQQGDVIYIETRGMLFYVVKVEHNYQEGSSFTTTLTLRYGHTPGEYIPIPLDVIGKMLYNNKDIATNIVQRQTSSFNETNIGVIIKDRVIDSSDDISQYQEENSIYANANIATINKLLKESSKMLSSNGTRGTTLKAVIELRYYSDENNEATIEMKDFVQSIKAALTGVADMNDVKNLTNINDRVTVHSDYVDIINVNMSKESDPRSPSQKAFDACRNYIATNPPLSGFENVAKDRIKYALYANIIDCWVSFKEVSKEDANPVGI